MITTDCLFKTEFRLWRIVHEPRNNEELIDIIDHVSHVTVDHSIAFYGEIGVHYFDFFVHITVIAYVASTWPENIVAFKQ